VGRGEAVARWGDREHDVGVGHHVGQGGQQFEAGLSARRRVRADRQVPVATTRAPPAAHDRAGGLVSERGAKTAAELAG
jgi:hypothetical protein